MIKINNLTFKLDNEHSTAMIAESKDSKGNVFIPRFIYYLSKKYTITEIDKNAFKSNQNIRNVSFANDSEVFSIGPKAFAHSSIEKITIPTNVKKIQTKCFSFCKHLKSIDFADDSHLKTFTNNIFANSSINSIKIPKNLEFLENFWCSDVKKLTNISISSENTYFKYYDDKMIIGRANRNTETFDILFFVRRDVQNIIIPSFIKEIREYTFSYCTTLKSIEFDPGFSGASFDDDAFIHSPIVSLLIPNDNDYMSLNLNGIKAIEFLGNKIEDPINIENGSLFLLSFPNCDKINLQFSFIGYCDIVIYIKNNAKVYFEYYYCDISDCGFGFD